MYDAVTDSLNIYGTDQSFAGGSTTVSVASKLVDWPDMVGLRNLVITVNYLINPCTDPLQNSIVVPSNMIVNYTIEDSLRTVSIPSTFSSALSGCGSV